MVLYHIISSYHLLCAILHRCVYNSSQKAILLIPDFFKAKMPDILKIEKVFFDEAYFFPYMTVDHNLNTMKSAVNTAYKTSVPYFLTDFEHIYVAGTQFYFTELLLQQEIHFECFEEAAGIFSHPKILKRNIGLKYSVQKKWADKNQLINLTNPLIEKIYCLYSAQKNNFNTNKTEDFSPCRILNSMAEAQRNKIIDFYIGRKRYKGKTDAVIILTEQLANLGKMSQKQQEKTYSLMSQKIPSNLSIYVKPHPDDKTDYKNIFNNGIIIEENFPSELLPFIFEKCPKYITTRSSAGIHNLKEFFSILIL